MSVYIKFDNVKDDINFVIYNIVLSTKGDFTENDIISETKSYYEEIPLEDLKFKINRLIKEWVSVGILEADINTYKLI